MAVVEWYGHGKWWTDVIESEREWVWPLFSSSWIRAGNRVCRTKHNKWPIISVYRWQICDRELVVVATSQPTGMDASPGSQHRNQISSPENLLLLQQIFRNSLSFLVLIDSLKRSKGHSDFRCSFNKWSAGDWNWVIGMEWTIQQQQNKKYIVRVSEERLAIYFILPHS